MDALIICIALWFGILAAIVGSICIMIAVVRIVSKVLFIAMCAWLNWRMK